MTRFKRFSIRLFTEIDSESLDCSQNLIPGRFCIKKIMFGPKWVFWYNCNSDCVILAQKDGPFQIASSIFDFQFLILRDIHVLFYQHSFVEIDHEIFSTVILSLPLIQEGQLSVSGERMCTILVNRLED